MEELHKPVLLSEVLKCLQPAVGESYLDLTAGYGGHASEILAVTRNYKDSVLVDRDENAIKVLEERFRGTGMRLLHEDFYSAVLHEMQCGDCFDIILVDFGVSSPQLDIAARGFSFAKDGPLDMRMDARQNLTAADVVNRWSERELVEIFVKYAEERVGTAKLIAKTVVHGRPWKSTVELGEALRRFGRPGKTHPATRIFQAIRIVVNDELGEIENMLKIVPKVMNPGGRIALIMFHSLEDRLVKTWMREQSEYGEESEIEIITKKPIVADTEELFINPRSRSAKLRVAKKLK